MRMEFRSGDLSRSIDVRLEGGRWILSLDGLPVAGVEILETGSDRIAFRRNGRRHEAWVARRGLERLVFLDGCSRTLHIGGDEADDVDVVVSGGPRVVSEMPGRVVKVLVAEGQDVAAGAPLLILEAMKMESEILAPVAGQIRTVAVVEGSTVAVGNLLVDIEPLEGTDQ